MLELRYRIVNVFVEALGSAREPHPQQFSRLSGNPLCVFEDGTQLDTATMQALARQFNLSETTFLLPSDRADARVRIFTPSFEMPFAGHPTLGSAFVAQQLGRGGSAALRLEMQAGVIAVHSRGPRFELESVAPRWRAFSGSASELMQSLGLTEDDLAANPLWVNAGNEQLLVPIRSEAAVRRVKPDPAALFRFTSADDKVKVYLFSERPGEPMLARFLFRSGDALLEDPATGSAAANLGGFLLARQAALPLRREIAQGEYTGRPSRVQLAIDASGRVFVAGDVVELAHGVLSL